MDVENSLRELKKTADATIMKKVVFTAKMEQNVRERTSRGKQRPALKFNWWTVGTAVGAILLFLLVGTQGWLGEHTNFDHRAAATWQPSPLQEAKYDGKPYSYYGDKPVRIITGEFYEDHGQKVIWLLDGSFASHVDLVATNQQGERIKLGNWQVGGALYDAAGHFPSSITLPSPGIWNLEVISEGSTLGSVMINVLEGYSPPIGEFIENLVVPYLEKTNEFSWVGDERFASIHLIGVQNANAEKKTAYAWVLVESYKKKEGETVSTKGGFSGPMSFSIVYINNQYRVVSHQLAEDGEQYWPSIERMYPPKYLNKLLEITRSEKHNQMVKDLSAENLRKAESKTK